MMVTGAATLLGELWRTAAAFMGIFVSLDEAQRAQKMFFEKVVEQEKGG